MLETLNRYAHGFVAIPVVVACRDERLFETLNARGPMRAEELAAELRANEGHLRAALRLLHAVGWLAEEQGRYSVTPEAELLRDVPGDAVDMLRLPVEDWLQGDGREPLLAAWVDRSQRRWETRSPRLADLIDGPLVVRVLTALQKGGWLKEGTAGVLDRVRPAVRQELARLFEGLGWANRQAGAVVLTEVGRFVLDRALILGTLAAYTPMLARMPELLFGDAAKVFDRDAAGQERHVDRTLNVASSGFQHDRYFADVDEMLVAVFDKAPFEDQPTHVADMGCGDGTFLRRVYETVRTRTARGKVLAEHPLTLVGLDFNDAALAATRQTLAGLPHVLLKGDIGDPEALLLAFQEAGVDPAAVLHIRSFLDHDRPFVPGDPSRADRRASLGHRGVYVDADGRAIPPTAMMQALVEHLARWAKVVNRHGLVVLEVHNLEPRIANAYFDSTESIHFDAYHAFSMQYLVEAADFLGAAAEAGLFPRPGSSRRYPKTLPFTRISLNWLERRPYAIRPAYPEDVAALLDLERAASPLPLQAGADEIRARMERAPGGQVVVENAGRIVAAAYSQRIADPDALQAARHEDLAIHHVESGPTVQLLGLVVHPEFQDRGLGDELLEFVLQRAEVLPGVETVAGLSRCKEWVRDGGLSFSDYAHARTASGEPKDPVLRFHARHGAQVKAVVRGYRPSDVDNDGCGVLIEYHLADRRPGARTERQPGSSLGPGRVPAVVEASVREVLGPRRQEAFLPGTALMDMGLDSMDLTELKSLLSRRLRLELDPTLFFRHRTPEAVATHLASLSAGSAPVPTAPSATRAAVSPARSTESASVSPVRPAPPRSPSSSDPIAIVGMACRFASANSAQEYWTLLRDGIHAIQEAPADRPGWSRLTDPDPAIASAIRLAGFLDQVDGFDASFFGISPREARSMDPQQRILLETSWHAFEDAGLDPLSLARSSTGVFMGIYTHDYEMLQLLRGSPQAFDSHFTSGNLASVGSGRIAYCYGFHGPAISVDTACSSSLTAVHLAAQSLRAGECDLALAGGINLLLAQETSLVYARLRVLAPDGRCKTFDASADGYVRGEGCGVVVLKRLEKAQAEGDRILAVIRGSAINQDGASNGLTAPNGDAQEAVIRRALAAAGVSPLDVSYVEAHGTGTVIGDPIEVAALGRVYGPGRSPEHPLVIGSAKTAIGHVEPGAGVAGLIKVTLSLQNEHIPPHLHFKEANPLIRLEEIPAVVPTEGRAWPRSADGAPRLAGISSFGLSGTNVHVIVEEPPVREPAGEPVERPAQVLVLSARTPTALDNLARSYGELVRSRPEQSLAPVCFTAATGRAHLEHRRAVVFQDRAELLAELAGGGADGAKAAFRGVSGSRPPRIAFLFSGQGSQYAGMGRELFETEPVFRAALEECDQVLRAACRWPLLSVLYPQGGAGDLTETSKLQPALFAFEYALYRLWRSWGVEPHAVLGHSLGEYVAACVAGVMTLEDALWLVAARGRLMGGLAEKGVMVAVATDAARAAAAIAGREGEVSIGSLNGPLSVVLSGRRDAVEAAVRTLEGEGIRTRALTVSNAFHSPLMEPILDAFEEEASRITLRPPERMLISNLLGRAVTHEVTTPAYWRRHLREAVRFGEGIQSLLQADVDAFIEIGPGATLLGLGRLASDDGSRSWLPSLRPGQPEAATLLQSLAGLYVRGGQVDWAAFYGGKEQPRIALPAYPFERKSYWFDDGERARAVPEGSIEIGATNGKGVVVTDYYNAFSEVGASPEMRYLTFAPFPEVVPGFSWVRSFGFPETHPEHVRFFTEAQRELRGLLFRHVDFRRAARVLDFGCGYGSDLIDLGREHPHLQLRGFSLSDRQVEVANRRAAEAGLEGRVQAFKKDSAGEAFPADNDVIFGFEVAHHVRDKAALFANVGRHLREGGALLLADFISETGFPIEHAETSSYFPTRDQWVELLSQNGLAVEECVDVSLEVANCLFDPQFEENLEAVLRVKRDENIGAAFRSYDQLGRLLQKKLARYVLLTARKSGAVARNELVHLNQGALSNLTPYGQVSLAQGCYEVAWRPKPSPATSGDLQGRWLVLADRQGVGDALAARIHAAGGQCDLVPAPATVPSFEGVASGAYRGVVHLWSLDAPGPEHLGPQALAEAQVLGAETVPALVQAAANASGDSRPKVWLITRGAQATGHDDARLAVAQAPLLGVARTLQLEHPELWGGMVDVEDGATEAQAAAVLAELRRSDGEGQVAYRKSERLAARLVRRPPPPPRAFEVKADASYLVAGGLGALGLEVARWLAEQGARNVVLAGRQAPSETARAVLQELEAAGVRAEAVRVDISRLDHLQAVLADLRRSMPPLRGVVNAAGVLDDGVLREQTAERLRSVALPKVAGSWNLHLATRDVPLDFFVCFSSVVTLLGSAGQGSYAAANAFMDALAHYRRGVGVPGLSVNWGAWAAGMAARLSAARRRYWADRGMGEMKPREALRLLGHLIEEGRPQAGVFPIAWERFLAADGASTPPPFLEEVARPESGPAASDDGVGIRGRIVQAPEGKRRDLLTDYVRLQVAKVLGSYSASAVHPAAGFRAMGMDSLMSLELRNRLQRDLECRLPATLTMDYPDVNALAAHLGTRLQLFAGGEGSAAPAGAPPPDNGTDSARPDLSDKETEALLLNRLEEMEY